MKKFAKLLILSMVVIAITFMGYKIISKIQYKEQVTKKIQSLPKFQTEDLKGNFFTDKMIESSPFALFYFNSGCHYCQNETETIKNNIESFKQYQLIFISDEPKDTIQKFANTYKLTTYDNIRFLFENNFFKWLFSIQKIVATFLGGI